MVASFMTVFAAVFMILLVIIDKVISWIFDKGLFWTAAAIVGTAVWMALLPS